LAIIVQHFGLERGACRPRKHPFFRPGDAAGPQRRGRNLQKCARIDPACALPWRLHPFGVDGCGGSHVVHELLLEYSLFEFGVDVVSVLIEKEFDWFRLDIGLKDHEISVD
jgi:hypothetical protein